MTPSELEGSLAVIGRLGLTVRQLEDVVQRQNELIEQQAARIEELTPPDTGDAEIHVLHPGPRKDKG